MNPVNTLLIPFYTIWMNAALHCLGLVRKCSFAILLSGLLGAAITQKAETVTLFDDHSFKGWEGNTQDVWRIENQTIVGASMDGNPQNEFLATTRSFDHFRLTLEYKLVGSEGFVNGGVQFRS